MHRISALLQKRSKEGRHGDVEDDLYSYSHEDSSDGSQSFRSPPRLVRSPALRGWRNAEDTDLSRFSLANSTDHTSESASILASGTNAAFDRSSRYSSNFQMGSPLPSPPRSPILGPIQAPSLWPLPSPRQQPKRHEDNESHQNGILLGHSDNRNGLMLEGEMHKSLQSMMSTENLQRSSVPSGLTVSSSPRVGGKGRGNSGMELSSRYSQFVGSAEVPSHVHVKQVEPSSQNGRIVKPMRSLEDSKVQRDPWHWTPEQSFRGDPADEASAVEHSHMQKYSYQNGAPSRDGGYSPRHPEALGSPTLPSPPLSPSASRALSPGGWIKGHLLGSGAFGKVYKGIHSGTGEFCAIKEVEFVQNDHRSKEAAEQLKKEVASLSTLQHPNIVQYKGSELVGDTLFIYLELISGGSLYKLYQEFKKLEEPVIRRYTRQILLGLHYLHSRKFVHRDIKCANILVDQDGTIKLADFGVAKYIKEQGVPFSLKGSPHWMAPEVIMSTNTGHEYAVDIWSLGCTVIEMVTGKPPWCDLEAAAAMFKITKIGAPSIPESLSADGKSFLRLCLQRNPADRPTAGALLEHPFVQIQGEAHHNAVHAFDALNSLQEYGESRVSSSSSFQVGMHPSSSAPSSPRSSYRTLYELNNTHADLVSHQREINRHAPMTIVERSKSTEISSALPHNGRYGKPKGRIPPVAQRRSHEFTHTQARSAPVSPKSSHMYGGLSHSGDVLAGYPTPFSDSRGT